MMSATYFGEITELDSRAVWYSDEEDEDSEDDEPKSMADTNISPLGSLTHEKIASSITTHFEWLSTVNYNFTKCIISSASSPQFNNIKPDGSSMQLIGYIGTVCKAFAFPIDQKGTTGSNDEYLLWLLFDSSHQYLVGYEVGYFVEDLREKLTHEFNLRQDVQVIILSCEFSDTKHLRYLNTYTQPSFSLPFTGWPLLPPSLIKNQFESALFEQFTLTLRLAFVVCLPNPKNFWFDRTKNWPSVPDQIIGHKLNDDNLEKTLIFT